MFILNTKNKIRTITLPLAVLLVVIFIIFLINTSFAQTEKDKPSLQLTNKLGIIATVSLPAIKSNNFIDHFRKLQSFLLKMADGIYMVIPFEAFSQAELVEGDHVVTLINGEQLKGRLLGEITSGDKTYTLSSMIKVQIVGMPESEQKQFQSTSKDIWELQIKKPVELSYSISDPQFGYTYDHRYKHFLDPVGSLVRRYEMRTEECKTTSKSFSISIRLKGEEIPAYLDDFEEISLDQMQKKITLKAPSGVETTGYLVLQCNEEQIPKEWLFMAKINDELGMTLLTIKPTILTIKKSVE